jgi:choline kinase
VRQAVAPELVVMAAGVGSRYGTLKQVEPVGPGGEILMDYAVWDAWRAGFERAVFVIRKEMESEFHDRHGRRYARRLEVAYAFQELDSCLPTGFAPPVRSKPWGTAHAVLAARDQVTAPFIAINADDFYGASGFQALIEFLGDGFLGKEKQEGTASGGRAAVREPERYALVAYELAKTLSLHGAVARGICEVSADGSLRKITEHTNIKQDREGIRGTGPDGTVRRLGGSEPVSMNLWGFRPSIFTHLEERFDRFLVERGRDPGAELYLPTVVDELIHEEKARVRVLHTLDRWFGVTYKEDRDEVAAYLRERVERGEYPERLWE